ncbi:Hypothetical protein mma_1707 [Janthinobacterium sp. Marseille]|nr:Hypothetical protein mma_1707 [Janthinobacterium sp. Marseille]
MLCCLRSNYSTQYKPTAFDLLRRPYIAWSVEFRHISLLHDVLFSAENWRYIITSHIKYRPDIDGLRAVAILPVVIFHAFPQYVIGGFVGVDIFFVISGFLISSIIIKEINEGKFTFQQFYARRIKRIFPALILILTTCLAAGWIALMPNEFDSLGKHVLSGAGFVSNFVLLSELGYFDSAAEFKPLLHLWSLKNSFISYGPSSYGLSTSENSVYSRSYRSCLPHHSCSASPP